MVHISDASVLRKTRSQVQRYLDTRFQNILSLDDNTNWRLLPEPSTTRNPAMSMPSPSFRVLHCKNISENSDKLYIVRVDMANSSTTPWEVVISWGATKDQFLKDQRKGRCATEDEAWEYALQLLAIKQKSGYVMLGSAGYAWGLRVADVQGKIDLTRLARGALSQEEQEAAGNVRASPPAARPVATLPKPKLVQVVEGHRPPDVTVIRTDPTAPASRNGRAKRDIE